MLTRDAYAALRREGFSRRDFLRNSGALIVGFSIAGQTGTRRSSADRLQDRLDERATPGSPSPPTAA